MSDLQVSVTVRGIGENATPYGFDLLVSAESQKAVEYGFSPDERSRALKAMGATFIQMVKA